ncbi:MAG: dicarboxylate/amino acid:cation symporter [Sphingobacteriia bacterium]|nr:dicarboxylate/amino acid:cation symporter [Sphingobacteriia bacterium]
MRFSFPLHARIFVGMITGAALGLICRQADLPAETLQFIIACLKPVGDIFLRMIFMMVIPLIFSALTLGVAELGDLRRIGRIGMKTLGYSILITGISVLIGITMVEIFRPGDGMSETDRTTLLQQYAGNYQKVKENVTVAQAQAPGDLITKIVPRNPLEDMVRAFDPTYTGGGLLAVMFLSVMMGIALSSADPDKTQTFRKFLEGLYEIVMKIIGYAMQLAPFGVAALLFQLTANLGYGVLLMILKYVILVLVALAIHQFGTYSLAVRFLGGMNPIFFFKNIREVMLTAFATSSSNASLPDAIRVTVEKLKIPREIANFVLTVGSTANQNGTALYEGITVLFLAQCFGVDLTLTQQITVVVMSVLAGIGTAGVPGGSLPLMVTVLMSVGIPGESITLIYGADRILDMSRTVLNVTGDITAAVVINRSEKATLAEP